MKASLRCVVPVAAHRAYCRSLLLHMCVPHGVCSWCPLNSRAPQPLLQSSNAAPVPEQQARDLSPSPRAARAEVPVGNPRLGTGQSRSGSQGNILGRAPGDQLLSALLDEVEGPRRVLLCTASSQGLPAAEGCIPALGLMRARRADSRSSTWQPAALGPAGRGGGPQACLFVCCLYSGLVSCQVAWHQG